MSWPMLGKPMLEDVLHIANYMRPMDWKEISGLRWNDSRESLAHDIMHQGEPFYLAALPTGEPVYVFGAAPTRPGVWQVWGFGTDKFPAVWREVTRFVKRYFVPQIGTPLCHRVECFSLVEKVDGRAWLRRLGGVETP